MAVRHCSSLEPTQFSGRLLLSRPPLPASCCTIFRRTDVYHAETSRSCYHQTRPQELTVGCFVRVPYSKSLVLRHSVVTADTLQMESPEASNDGLSNSDSTPQSSLQELSYHSTPVPMQATISSMPAQSGLLGLNCHFAEDGLPAEDEHVARRAKMAMKRSHPSRLLRHKRSRPSEQTSRVFACDYCDMKFDRKSNLKDHKRTHGEGKRPVTCKVKGCNKSYGRQADVNRHVRSVSSSTPNTSLSAIDLHVLTGVCTVSSKDQRPLPVLPQDFSAVRLAHKVPMILPCVLCNQY